MEKKKVIKDLNKLSDELLKLLKETYPNGYEKNMVSFLNANHEYVSAIPLETEEYSYLIKLPRATVKPPKDEDEDDANDFEDIDFENIENVDEVDADASSSFEIPDEE